jgi:solute carrier family 26 (sodium-independent sulfate anion transporter), member 11
MLGYYLTQNGLENKIALTNDVKSGLPPFRPPQFSWNNRTFGETFLTVSSSVPFLVLVSSLEAIAVAKTFSAQSHYKIIPSQELIALGMANIATSFFQGYPITGSFTRSALASQSGVRTQMSCVWTGAFVLMATAVISQVRRFWELIPHTTSVFLSPLSSIPDVI